MKLEFTWLHRELAIRALATAPERARVAASEALATWSAALASYIIGEKLSGQVLHRRSGRLSSSVHPFDDPGTLTAGAKAGADVPYARIHEEGGLIPAHLVIARKAKALKIPLAEGETIYRRSAMIPEVTMPQRSYMRTSLYERAPDAIAAVRQAVMEATA